MGPQAYTCGYCGKHTGPNTVIFQMAPINAGFSFALSVRNQPTSTKIKNNILEHNLGTRWRHCQKTLTTSIQKPALQLPQVRTRQRHSFAERS
jgi:hypothetical protein